MSDLEKAVAKLKDLEAKIVAKGLQDDEFRKKLLKDPKAAVAEVAGKSLPDGLVVKVQEEASNTLTIILPKKAGKAKAKGELSEKALSKVAGGGAIADFVAKAVVDVV
ncbi:MAG: NHLP leader peptide family RiPP precursor [Planctomycetota bacterium]